MRELTIAATPNFSPEGYADVAKLKNSLTFLNVNANNNINEESLHHIFSMTNLRVLMFVDAKVTDPGIYSGLVKMTQLRKLYGMILYDNETLSYLAQVYSLTAFGFQSGQNTAPAISAKYLSKLTELKEMTGIRIINAHHLASLTNLERLPLYRQTIDENFPWQRMTKLSSVYVDTIDSKALQKISNLVNLTSLTFQHLTNPQKNDFEGIERCQYLRTLNFSNRPITDKRKCFWHYQRSNNIIYNF